MKKVKEQPSSKGYKIFDSNFQCRGFQFAENSRYKEDAIPKICSAGFHYCTKASDCFCYYDFDPKNIICEVLAYGIVDTHKEDSKQCTNDIFIGKRLTWQEVLFFANEGVNNTGHSNSGDRNSGYSNSGNWNSGDRNSGDSNSGAFCIDDNPYLMLFDKHTKIKVRDWEKHSACNLMYKIDTTIWVPMSIMNDEEKKCHPKYETTEGYLKTISMKEAWANMWGNLSDENKKVFTDLPGFDTEIFETITGIKIILGS